MLEDSLGTVGAAANTITSLLSGPAESPRNSLLKPGGASDPDYLDSLVKEDPGIPAPFQSTIRSELGQSRQATDAVPTDLVARLSTVTETDSVQGIEAAPSFDRCVKDLQRALDPTSAG